jgi:hypothetical protein
MKSILLVAFAIASSAAIAKPKVFSSEAEYTKPGWDSRFDQLEQDGIERAAEKRAYAQCVASGATDCVILESAYIESCHYMTAGGAAAGCKAIASARGDVQ